MGFLVDVVGKNSWVVLLAIVVGFVLCYILKKRRLPPGPRGLPFVGYLPFLPDLKHETTRQTFERLRKKYGDIFSLRLGFHDVVVLNSQEIIQEGYSLNNFSGRPQVYSYWCSLEAGETSLIFIDGEKWKRNRKFCNRALGLFNASRDSSLEPVVQHCLAWLYGKLDKSLGTPIETRPLLTQWSGAVITSLTFGHFADPDDPFLQKLFELSNSFEDPTGTNMYLEFIPWLRWLYPKHTEHVTGCMKELIKNVKAYMDSYHPNQGRPKNIADALSRAASEAAAENQRYGLTEDEVKGLAVDLFDAAFVTTSESLEWFLLFLAKYPETQKKLQKEIDEEIGPDAIISYQADAERMPYTKACVTEGLRYGSSTGVTLYHASLADTMFHGYFIPKDTVIMGNLYSVNFDPKVYPDPFIFKPERYLKPDGTYNGELAEKLLNFSFGKRRCPGEAMAKVNLFIALACLMQKYEVKLDPDTQNDPINEVSNASFTVGAGAHKLIFEKR